MPAAPSAGQAQDCPAEGAAGEGSQAKATGEEGGKVSVGMATIPMSLIQEMVGRHGPRKPACSPKEEAERLLRAYADYAQPNVFTAGQLVAPKSMGREVDDCGPFGVVLGVDAVPGPGDAPNETLRIGRFSDDGFRVAVYDPLRFQPYVPGASQPDLVGNEVGA